MRISLQLCFHRLLVPHPVLHLYLVLTPHPVQFLYYIWFFWNFAPDVLFPFFIDMLTPSLTESSSSFFSLQETSVSMSRPVILFFFFIPKILFSKTITAHLLDGFISRLILMLLQILPSPLHFIPAEKLPETISRLIPCFCSILFFIFFNRLFLRYQVFYASPPHPA